MEALFNILVNLAVYVSIPAVIRYAILRRPIQRKWIAICILVPIFIVFAAVIGTQREEAQRKISEQVGIPYGSTPHMIGSPILYVAMILSYAILRRSKKTKPSTNPMMPANDEAKRPAVCPKCKAKLSTDSVFCHKCGEKISQENKT